MLGAYCEDYATSWASGNFMEMDDITTQKSPASGEVDCRAQEGTSNHIEI
jgi:hypothetical protein